MPKVTDQTELTAAPAATDMFLVSEISSGLSKKINFNRMISGYRNFTTGAWTFPAPTAGVLATFNGFAGSNVVNFLGGASNGIIGLISTAAAGVGVGVEAKNSVQTWQFGLGVGVGDSSWYLSDTTRGAQPLKVTITGNVSIPAPSSGKAVAVDGEVTVASGTATPAGGTAGKGLTMGTTANLGVFFGSGAPTLSAAQGSLYIRTDGSSTSTRMYVNTTGSTVWTNVTTAT